MNKEIMNSEPIWKSWFARHGAKLLLFARQQSRRPDEAEDLLQEAFVRIWRLYGHTGEVAPGLVYRAIRRLAIDWARSIDRRQARENRVALDAPRLSLSTALWNRMSANRPSSGRSNAYLRNKKKWSL